jgi:hypothetical protein
MTRKLLILAYIAAVLALSGMVRADGFQGGRAFVTNATISNTGILHIDGVFKSLCLKSPRVVATAIGEHDIQFMVEGKRSEDMCPQVIVRQPFQVISDLKELPLKPGNQYTIKFDNFEGSKNEFSYKALPSQVDGSFKFGPRDFKGYLVHHQNVNSDGTPDGLVLQRGDNVIPVVSPDMIPDLERFKGEVNVTGYVSNIATLNGGNASISQDGQVSQVIVPVSVSQ